MNKIPPNQIRILRLLAVLGLGGILPHAPVHGSEQDALGVIPSGLLEPLDSPEPELRRRPSRPPPRSLLRRDRGTQQADPSATRLIQHHLSEAQAYDRAGRWRSALMEYQTLIRLEPDNASHWLRAALLSTMVNQYNLADHYFTELHEQLGTLHPNHSIAWVESLLHLQEFERASEILSSALIATPTNLRARYYELIINQRAGQDTEPQFWLLRSLAQQIQVMGWMGTGEANLRSWIGDDGLQDIVNTVFGDMSLSDLPEAYNALRDAWTELEREDWSSALPHLQTAQDVGATQPHIFLETARCLMRMGNDEAASQQVKNILEMHASPPELAYPAAYVLIGAQQYESAATILQTAIDAGLEVDRRIQIALAYALAGSDSMDEAWPMIASMAEAYPDEFPEWMERDEPHIRAIRTDPRFNELLP